MKPVARPLVAIGRFMYSALSGWVVLGTAGSAGCHMNEGEAARPSFVASSEARASDLDRSLATNEASPGDSARDAQDDAHSGSSSIPPPEDLVALRTLLAALQANDRATVSRLMPYPVDRSQPLASVANPEEFLRNYDDFFDANTIALVVNASDGVWHSGGQTLVAWGERGLIDIVSGRLVEVRVETDQQHAKAARAREAEAMTLHPSVRDYAAVVLECENKHHHIRIHRELDPTNNAGSDTGAVAGAELAPRLRYIAWKTGE
ncbi:MAG TPA: hypothetical protein VEK07_01810, partial [Polyangiaceae bacterium]|nr:hypothetical protein [Polyangiaceae bacterium]